MNESPHQKKKKGERERNTLFLKIEESREGDAGQERCTPWLTKCSSSQQMGYLCDSGKITSFY
jgi:hypothetical protein